VAIQLAGFTRAAATHIHALSRHYYVPVGQKNARMQRGRVGLALAAFIKRPQAEVKSAQRREESILQFECCQRYNKESFFTPISVGFTASTSFIFNADHIL
jgi:hypothetical protein